METLSLFDQNLDNALIVNRKGVSLDLLHRLMKKIYPVDCGCWIWVGSQNDGGYGTLYARKEEFNRPVYLLHRLTYEIAVGPIPFGYQIHHKCENKLCCNPEHLEKITPIRHSRLSNTLRGQRTHCCRGHEFTAENTVWSKRKKRKCRTCLNERSRSIYREVFGEAAPKTHCDSGHEFTDKNIYWYTSTTGYKARGCKICRREARRAGTIAARKKFAANLKHIKPKTTHCIHGHEFAVTGYAVKHTGSILCSQCARDQANAKNAAKREAAGPKPYRTECRYGHGFENLHYVGDRYTCRECARLRSLKYAQKRAAEYKELGIKHIQRTRKPYILKTHCPKGHPYENMEQKSGRKACVQCRIEKALANGTAVRI